MVRHIGSSLLLLGLVLAGFWLAWPAQPTSRTLAADKESLVPETHAFQWQGVSSCSATACHGDSGAKGSKGSEYTTWASHDKHAQAYTVLFSERSRTIVKNWRKLEKLEDAHPENEASCLACHSMNIPKDRQGTRFALMDGIGCESCHGPAEKWRLVHYRDDWKAKTAEQKVEMGFRQTKDLTARCQSCIDCHVGTLKNNVDHDLIAAGHPRLAFEYGAYLANMPKHWNEHVEKKSEPALEARAWAIGQILSGQRHVEIIEHWAKDHKKAWPEFAAYDCFACHRDLSGTAWRNKKPDNLPPGALAFGSWYSAMIDHAIQSESESLFDKLRKEMTKPQPDRTKVAELAEAAAHGLGRRLIGVSEEKRDAGTLRQQLDKIAGMDADRVAGWDNAAQCYLALAAFYNGMTDVDPRQRNPQVKAVLGKMAEELCFPAKKTKNIDSPRRESPAEFGKQLKALHKLMEKQRESLR